MPDPGVRFQAALAAIDAASAEDPSGRELEYARRMSAMLERFAPQASEVVRLAARAQHIGRWKTPRASFPDGREGYLKWRTQLYGVHAEAAGKILAAAGYDTATVERVKSVVAKKMLRADPEAQLLEDVVALVFLESYLAEFAEQHGDYEEAKFIDILRKTWKKMSRGAREFVLSEKIAIPGALLPVVRKAAHV